MFANKNHAGSRCARCHNLLKEEDSAEYREGAWYHKMCWDEGVRQLNTAMKRAAEPSPDPFHAEVSLIRVAAKAFNEAAARSMADASCITVMASVPDTNSGSNAPA